MAKEVAELRQEEEKSSSDVDDDVTSRYIFLQISHIVGYLTDCCNHHFVIDPVGTQPSLFHNEL
jgi:hypothetical protein